MSPIWIPKNRSVAMRKTEVRLAEYVGKHRYEEARRTGTHNALRDTGSRSRARPEQPDIDGALAELAFCRLFGIYPEELMEDVRQRSATRGEDDGGDVTIMGLGIDVKSTRYTHGKLMTPEWKKAAKCDAYCLMTIGQSSVVYFRGFMPKELFITESRRKPDEKNKAKFHYEAEQKDLMDHVELAAWFKENRKAS